MLITVQDLDRWGACGRSEQYSDGNLKKLLRGRPGLSPLQVARLRSVPVDDRLWVLLRPEVLEDHFDEVLFLIVERPVRQHALKCGIPEVEKWAARWLSGADRSEEAAWEAETAAWAAEAAAARAARAAATAAAAEAETAAEAAVWDTERQEQLKIVKRCLQKS